ncbi:hypothetical protein BGW41_001332 [Actinomortierella wolfii]|nr:hypothetical protein BGW41_001332 [Actinomortierella wolfii]
MAHPADIDTSSISRGLEIQAITRTIRHYLTGLDLKNLVLVNRQWWRAFAPFLWEKLFINETEEDQYIILRNGQVVQEMAIVVHERETKARIEWLFASLAKSCPNIYTLHLKLYSPLQFDSITGNPLDMETQPHQPHEVMPFLHDLLSHFPNVTTLNLQLAHPDLPATVVLAATRLPYLRELGVFGGLKQRAYTLHKNRHCDWDVLFWTVRKCLGLRTLRLSWRDDNNCKSSSHALQDALTWLEKQGEASSVEHSIPTTTTRYQTAQNVPIDALQGGSESSSSIPAIPPQLEHLRQLYLTEMECPVLATFQRLVHHCPRLRDFAADTFVHRLDPTTAIVRNASSTENINVVKLRMLLEACGPTLQRLDLAQLTVGFRDYARTNYSNAGIGDWESWTSMLTSVPCQALQTMTIYAPVMHTVQEPNHLQYITHLTIDAVLDLKSLDRIMATGFPVLTHVTLAGCMVDKTSSGQWVYDHTQLTWIWVPISVGEHCDLRLWLARHTLKHVDLSGLHMDLENHIESLYDVVRSIDHLESLALPFGHLKVLEERARSLNEQDQESDSAGQEEVEPSQQESEPSSSWFLNPLTLSTSVSLRTQQFPRSLHTLRVTHDIKATCCSSSATVIKAKKHFATVVFDKMPGVRIMQLDQVLVGDLSKYTSLKNTNTTTQGDWVGYVWLEDLRRSRRKVSSEVVEDSPELDQPTDRSIQYQILY